MKLATPSCAIALLALSSTTLAQESFGLWEGLGTEEFYVSSARGLPGNPGTKLLPYQTITEAFLIADILAPLIPVTINIAPGTYSSAGAAPETFPITLPAYGLSLETWPDPLAPFVPTDRPIIVGNGMTSVLLVDEVGNEALPASVIQGLDISGGTEGILIDPALGGLPAVEVLAVEVRDNFIHGCLIGVEIETPANYASAHIVEHNVIGEQLSPGGWGINVNTEGASSTLIRSNLVQFWEANILVSGSGVECRPRLFSNFVQVAERNVNLANCDPFVINNTIAYAINFTSVPRVFGLVWTGNEMVLANNVIWNPVLGSMTAAADDLVTTGIVNATTNLVEDTAGGLTPGFIGGDAHPGFAGRDLHLGAGSAMIAAGTNALTVTPVVTGSIEDFGGNSMRIDVSMDVDLDGRVHRTTGEAGPATVEIGGDEYKVAIVDGRPECRMDWGNNGSQDDLGNHELVAFNTYSLMLELTGPSLGAFSILGGHTFDMVLGGAPNGPVYQNFLLSTPDFGSVLIDLDPSRQTTFASGSFDAAGSATITIPWNNVPIDFAETEVFLQMVTVDAAGLFATSNRLKLELN